MNRKTLILISLLFFIMVSPITVSCGDKGDINLDNVKKYLAEKFTISEFASGLLLTGICIMMFLLPIAVYSRGYHIPILVGIPIVGFCVAIGWCPYFIMLVQVLLCGALWSDKIKGWIG